MMPDALPFIKNNLRQLLLFFDNAIPVVDLLKVANQGRADTVQFSLNPFVVFCILGVVQALVLALALLTVKRGNRTANTILAALAVLISLLVAFTILNSTGLMQSYPHLSRINHPFDFVCAPLLFLYVKSLTSKHSRLGRYPFLHFVPAILCALFLTPFYLQSAGYKYSRLPSVNWYYTRSALVIVQFLIYLVLIAAMIVRYSKRVKDHGTGYEKAALSQVRFLAVSFLVLWVIGILRYGIDLAYPAYASQTLLILPSGATLIVYALAYLALRKPELLAGAEESPVEKKYQKSTLTPDRAERYLAKLLHSMEVEKVYTDGDLTLQKLAARLGVPAQHLSQVINERLNQSFLELVNTHRVEEAKRRLLDPLKSHLSILAVAEEVGFNSKSSFNSVFKKYTNMTPSEFRKVDKNGKG